MVFHARLDAAAAGLNAGTCLLHIVLADPDHRHAAQHGLLAGLREGGEMLFDAGPQPSLAGFDPGAFDLDQINSGLRGRS